MLEEGTNEGPQRRVNCHLLLYVLAAWRLKKLKIEVELDEPIC